MRKKDTKNKEQEETFWDFFAEVSFVRNREKKNCGASGHECQGAEGSCSGFMLLSEYGIVADTQSCRKDYADRGYIKLTST